MLKIIDRLFPLINMLRRMLQIDVQTRVYIVNKANNVSGIIPIWKQHNHDNIYIKKGTVVAKTKALGYSELPFALSTHTHSELVPQRNNGQSVVATGDYKGMPITYIKTDISRSLNNLMSYALSLNEHQHKDYMLKQKISNTEIIYTSKARSLETEGNQPSLLEHNHSQYALRFKKVDFASSLKDLSGQYSPASLSKLGHIHDEYNIESIYKSRNSGIERAVKPAFKLIRADDPNDTGEEKEISVRIPFLTGRRWLPDNMLATQLVINKTVWFYKRFYNALSYYVTNNESFHEIILRKKALTGGTIFLFFKVEANPIIFARILINKKHYSYFATYEQIDTTNLPVEASNYLGMVTGRRFNNATSFQTYVRGINTNLSVAQSMIRMLFDLMPDENYKVPISSLVNVGGITSSNNQLTVRTGGMAYCLLFKA